MSRLWVVAAALALLAVTAAVGMLGLAVWNDRNALTDHWPEVLMLALPAVASLAAVWAGRAARRPAQVAVCVAAGLTAAALVVGVWLMLVGRGYVSAGWRPPVEMSVPRLMGLPAATVLVAGLLLAHDRLAAGRERRVTGTGEM